MDRQRRDAPDKGAGDVRPTAEREQPEVGLDRLVDPAEPLHGQGRTGRPDGPQGRQVVLGARPDAGLQARRDECRAGPELRDPTLGRHLPQRAEIRMAGVAVVQDCRATDEQRTQQQVPHHPAGRREPEHPVAGTDIAMETHDLGMLEHDPAMTVDDRLRQTCRARRVDDPQRVIERQGFKGQRFGRSPRQLRPGHRRRAVGGRRRVEMRQQDRAFERRQRCLDLGQDRAPVEGFAAVRVAIHGEQHLGLDLGETVDQAAGPEVRRATRPDRPDRRAGQERHDGLRDVRHDRHDPVTATDPGSAQAGGDGRDGPLEFTPRDGPKRIALRLEDERRSVG